MRKRADLNRRWDMLMGGDLFLSNLKATSYRIHETTAPLNEIVWIKSRRLSDKMISMHDFKYVEYQDLINIMTKPFKRR